MSESLTKTEVDSVKAEIDAKIEAGNPQDLNVYEEIERIANEIRTTRRGKQFCISAEIDTKAGVYVVFVDDEAVAKGRTVPLEERERLEDGTVVPKKPVEPAVPKEKK